MKWLDKLLSSKIKLLENKVRNRNEMIDEMVLEKCRMERKIAEMSQCLDDETSFIKERFPIGMEFKYLSLTVRVTGHNHRYQSNCWYITKILDEIDNISVSYV